MRSLSERQQQILDMIRVYVRKNGYPPTVREIADSVGLSSISSVHAHLKNLEKSNHIRRNAAMSRAIEIVEDPPVSPDPSLPASLHDMHMVDVPFCGRITAGLPIDALEHWEETYPLPLSLVGSRDAFILEVVGDSMIEAGIHDGDLAIVEKRSTVANGEIAVAMLPDDTATIKRFYRENKRYRLQPENATMAPLYTDQVTVLGKVIGIYRRIP